MYLFDTNKKEDLLEGRTITYLANKLEKTKPYMCDILNGKRTCSKSLAYFIVKFCNNENEINDYFTRKEQ